MKINRLFLLIVSLFAVSMFSAGAQGLSVSDIPAPTREYKPWPGLFVGLGGGMNLSFNGNSFENREFSGLGAGTAMDAYVGMFTKQGLIGFGAGFQGLTVSDRFTEYGREQFLYGHGMFFLKLTDYFIPYAHVGLAHAQGNSVAGGLGMMFPIKITEKLYFVPNIKFTALRSSILSDRGGSLGMVTSASIGLRFDIGKQRSRKKTVEPVVVTEPVYIHDTVTVVKVQRDTVVLKEKEVVMKTQTIIQETTKEQEEKFNRDLSDAVLFETASFTLTPAAEQILDEVAKYIMKTPGIRTVVEGHTDNVGREEYNLTLSQNRAGAVSDYLISRGVNPFTISAVGYGKSRPKVPNTSAANRQQNRRVEVHFYKMD